MRQAPGWLTPLREQGVDARSPCWLTVALPVVAFVTQGSTGGLGAERGVKRDCGGYRGEKLQGGD